MQQQDLADTGERIIPTGEDELSFVFAQHQLAYKYAAQYATEVAVVDVGCGAGYGCNILAGHARFVCGVDYSLEALQYCRQHYAADNISYVQMSAMHLGFRRQFDIAVSFQTIEHLPDALGFFKQLKASVKPSGLIFITTPNVPNSGKAAKSSPFHTVEYDVVSFQRLLQGQFSSYELYGVSYKTKNLLRDVLQSFPLYRVGRHVKRKSKLKKVADWMLDLSRFQITRDDIENSIDLLAICKNL